MYPLNIICLTIFCLSFVQSQDLITGNQIQLLPNDPNLIKALFAVKSAIAKQQPKYIIDKVLSAQSQVVAGKKYIVTFQLLRLKNKPNKSRSASKLLCRAEIIVKPWRNVTELAQLKCQMMQK